MKPFSDQPIQINSRVSSVQEICMASKDAIKTSYLEKSILSASVTQYPSQAALRLRVLEEIEETGSSDIPSRLIKHLFNKEPTLTLLQWAKDNSLDFCVVNPCEQNCFTKSIRFTKQPELDMSEL